MKRRSCSRLMDKQHFKGAMYDPIEGHVDPYGVTHAYAKSAQIGGADIVRHTRVTDLQARADGSWDVITDHGNVHAEHVVNAGGLWAREVGRMVGSSCRSSPWSINISSPATCRNWPARRNSCTVIDFEGEIYIRQERGGMLMGTYERAGVPWSPVTTPWDFGQDLLPNDLERIAPSLEVGFAHFPALGRRGHQESGQRSVHLCSRRQSAGRPDPRLEEFLGGLRRHGGLQPGRRRRSGAVALDGRRRSGRRHLGHGRGALRGLGDACLHQRQGSRELLAALQHSLSERGIAGGAALAHHADLRKAAGRACRIRRLLRPRTSIVVRADGQGGRGSHQLPPLQCASARRRGVQGGAAVGGPLGNIQLRQVRHSRPRGGRMAVAHDGEPRPVGRPHCAHADAESSAAS